MALTLTLTLTLTLKKVLYEFQKLMNDMWAGEYTAVKASGTDVL